MSAGSSPSDREAGAYAEQARFLENRDGTVVARWSRWLGERTGRRGFLARIGRITALAAGSTIAPVLPVIRGAAAVRDPRDFRGTDPTDCTYWRYCNTSGRICATCAGGGATTCPPGTLAGYEYWVGCCTDPATGRTFLIASYDCYGEPCTGGRTCGAPFAQDTPFDSAVGSQDSSIGWAYSDPNGRYSCTIVPVLAEGCTPAPAAMTRAELEAAR